MLYAIGNDVLPCDFLANKSIVRSKGPAKVRKRRRERVTIFIEVEVSQQHLSLKRRERQAFWWEKEPGKESHGH